MANRPREICFAAICLLLVNGFNTAVTAQDGAQNPKRPRIGLALSGGGARGAAHVGVLRVLEEMRIPVDFIAGTSMGSIVAGLYASGMTPDQIEHAIRTIDWENIFDDDPPREDRSYRRKRDDDRYPIKFEPGIKDGELTLPTGLVQGQKLDLELRKLALPVANVHNFDQLPIPYRAVASNIGTGQSVVLAAGDIAHVMRASMAVPGVFAATEIDGQILVDGGITDNLPVDVVRDMGADIVIAVDVSTPLMKPDEVRNVIQITSQLTSILTRRNTEEQIASLGNRDILIVPDLQEISSSDFSKADQAIPLGLAAAEARRGQLARLAISEPAYRAHLADRVKTGPQSPVIWFVRIENNSKLADEVLRNRIHVREGEPLDTAQLDRDIGNIYGMELFESVDYQLVEEDGRTGIVVDARARSWGPDYLQFAFSLSGDTGGESTFNLGLAYLKTELNSLGGEVRFSGQIGADPLVAVDWYQPLDYDSRYFFEPVLTIGSTQLNIYSPGGAKKLAQYDIDEALLELSAGRELGDFGEVRLGYRRGTGNVELNIGNPALPEGDFDSGSVFGRFAVDRLDNAYFPSRGYNGNIEYEMFREGLGNDTNLDQLRTEAAYFHTFGKNTFGVGGAFNATLDGTAQVQNRFRLGGFLRLSGYDVNSLSGQYSAVASGVYYRRFAEYRLLPWYLGGSVEAGNVWEDSDDISLDSLIASGSVFVGAETPVGPFHAGYGFAENGHNAWFFLFGRHF